MNIGAATRRFLARRPWIHWLVVATLAAGVALGIAVRLADADEARAAWETTQEVWVADRDLEAGELAEATLRSYPTAAVPSSAIPSDEPPGRLRQRVAEGEMLVEADVTIGPGPAAGADDGQVVVAISDPLLGRVPVGVPVAVYAEGIVLADAGRIVEVDGATVYVAVEAVAAPMVAAAAHDHVATLAFTR